MPPLPSPTLQGTSPSGSKFSFSQFSPDGGRPEPKRKSSFGLSLKKDKEVDHLKLPKEFLAEFWGTLANEQGDKGWHEGVSTFLGMIKKGTKTGSGMNLREIPTLLEGWFWVAAS